MRGRKYTGLSRRAVAAAAGGVHREHGAGLSLEDALGGQGLRLAIGLHDELLARLRVTAAGRTAGGMASAFGE